MKWCELREYKWNEYVTIAVNRNLSNCEKARKKGFRGFEPVASALALQCSTSLSYEDPYTGGRPIYWVHQPVKGMKHRMKWCELREYKWNEYVTIAVNRNLSNCEKARKKGFRGFEPVASALALQCSTSLSYEDPYTGGRPIYWVHQPVKGMKHRMKWCELREYKWNEYVTIAVNRNLSNCEKARKKGFRGFNGIRTRGLCVSAAVLYQPELWRPIYWRPANLLSSSTRERGFFAIA